MTRFPTRSVEVVNQSRCEVIESLEDIRARDFPVLAGPPESLADVMCTCPQNLADVLAREASLLQAASGGAPPRATHQAFALAGDGASRNSLGQVPT